MGSGFNNTVWAIERFNSQIYAAGDFTQDMDRLPGEKARITEAMDAVIDQTDWLLPAIEQRAQYVDVLQVLKFVQKQAAKGTSTVANDCERLVAKVGVPSVTNVFASATTSRCSPLVRITRVLNSPEVEAQGCPVSSSTGGSTDGSAAEANPCFALRPST